MISSQLHNNNNMGSGAIPTGSSSEEMVEYYREQVLQFISSMFNRNELDLCKFGVNKIFLKEQQV